MEPDGSDRGQRGLRRRDREPHADDAEGRHVHGRGLRRIRQSTPLPVGTISVSPSRREPTRAEYSPRGDMVASQLAKGALDSYAFAAQPGEGVIPRVTDVAGGTVARAFNV